MCQTEHNQWDLNQKKAKAWDLRAFLIPFHQALHPLVSLFGHSCSGLKCQLNSICSRIFEKKEKGEEEGEMCGPEEKQQRLGRHVLK